MPWPVPQISMPFSASPFWMALGNLWRLYEVWLGGVYAFYAEVNQPYFRVGFFEVFYYLPRQGEA
ncbi:hypothetical protein MASR2M48_23440 [Spirochaetota bacterium]